ncbi:NAD(P)-binding oxidoreductase [Pseudomonas aeruginosa]|uniref:NAD(P)-binding oxidoreductase n=1 Tax=Pseudomonas aeruginosa TaxID=287 RepID=UPI003C7E8580
MSCPNLALVHTSIEHSRDWCRRLLILGCQEPYAHQALHPVRWCGRLLKTTAGRGRHVSDTFENYMKVKKQADVYLAQSGLDWVILRPGTLVDTAGTGRITAGPAIPYGDVPRDDVAATLAELIDQPTINRAIIELTQGTAPVRDALAALARQE